MMYLVLFATLSIGFYAGTTMSVQIVKNDRYAAEAQAAAESGMQFVKYQLANLSIPHFTPQDQLFTTIYNQLKTALDNTGNLGTDTVALVNGAICIPQTAGAFVSLGPEGAFSAQVSQSGQQLVVKVTGRGGNLLVTRGIKLNYGIAMRASAVFNYGIASQGKVTTGGSSDVIGSPDPAKGSILSATMTDATPVVAGGRSISGDISIVNPTGNVTVSGSVGGTSNTTIILRDHVHKGVEAPEFPTVDTAAFTTYATTAWDGTKNLTNMYIPPNTNPTFNGGANIKGVLYIKAPNKVKFRGNTVIQGVIVTENTPAGGLTTNTLDFAGNVSATGVETLPSTYGALRSLTGSFLLAPNYAVSFTGDFGTVNGSIIASKIDFTGNSGGIVKGSIINLNNVPMTVNGSADITIASTGTTNYPSGVFFGSNYVPLPDTYDEVK